MACRFAKVFSKVVAGLEERDELIAVDGTVVVVVQPLEQSVNLARAYVRCVRSCAQCTCSRACAPLQSAQACVHAGTLVQVCCPAYADSRPPCSFRHTSLRPQALTTLERERVR